MDITNTHLLKDRHIHISPINEVRSLVGTGPPQTLYDLNLSLRKVKAPTRLDQNRVLLMERKVRFTNRSLPISAPLHSLWLESETGIILEDLKEIWTFTPRDLTIPVFHTSTGQDLRDGTGNGSVTSKFVNMVTQQQVD